MNIEEMKRKQNEMLNIIPVKEEIKRNIPYYNELCDDFSIRYSKIITNIILRDVHNFFVQSELKYHQPDNGSFVIDGLGCKILITSSGFNINTKNGNKSFSVNLDKESQPSEYVWREIRFNEKIMPTSNLESFLLKINEMGLYELNNILDRLYESISTVKVEIEDLNSLEDNPQLPEHNYYELNKKENIYKTIQHIIEIMI